VALRHASVGVVMRSAVVFGQHQPLNVENKILVARRGLHFEVFWSLFLHAQYPQKEACKFTSNDRSPGQS